MAQAQKKLLQKAFNDHFEEFMNDIVTIFPDDVDIKSTQRTLIMMRKANPKLIIDIWNTYVSSKYASEIESGDISFFIDKDYAGDISNTGNSEQIMSAINRLRAPIKNMTADNQEKTMKYIQNLKKICDGYFGN